MMLNAFKLGADYPIFTKQIPAKKDPVTGDVLVPAFATQVDLIDEKVGHQRYFKNGAWHYVVDHIGTEYWNADGTQHTIMKLSEDVPDGALLAAPIIEPTDEEVASAARAQRNSLLAATDYMLMPDYSFQERSFKESPLEESPLLDASLEGKSPWLTYRQALRNISQQTGFPHQIDWPIRPDAILINEQVEEPIEEEQVEALVVETPVAAETLVAETTVAEAAPVAEAPVAETSIIAEPVDAPVVETVETVEAAVDSAMLQAVTAAVLSAMQSSTVSSASGTTNTEEPSP